MVKQNLHVEDRIDCHASLAYISGGSFVVGIVSPVRGKIERDRKSPLPGGQIATVKRVGLFRSGESGILPNRPGVHDIHRAVRAAQVGRNSRGIFKMLESVEVLSSIETLYRNVLRGEPFIALSRVRWFHRGLVFDL